MAVKIIKENEIDAVHGENNTQKNGTGTSLGKRGGDDFVLHQDHEGG